MTKRFCDICEQEMNSPEVNIEFHKPEKDFLIRQKSFELCSRCAENLYIHIKVLTERKTKARSV